MPELIPREVLFGNPERARPRLSPDGSRLAWIAPQGGVLNVWVAPVVAPGEPEGGGVDWSAARVVTDDTDRGIRMYDWSPDGQRLLYLKDSGGDENWRLYDVDLGAGAGAGAGAGNGDDGDGGGGGDRVELIRRDLTPFDGVQAQLIAAHPDVPGTILVGLNRDNPQLHDVYRLDLESGALSKVLENPGVVNWLADSHLTVRAAMRPLPDGGFEVVAIDPARGGEGHGEGHGEGAGEAAQALEWRTILTIPADDAASSSLAAVLEGEQILVTSSVGAETARLLACSLADGSFEELAVDVRADLVDVRLHPLTNEPQIAVFELDRSVYQALHPAFEADLAAVRAIEPGDVMFAGGDDADTVWLVGFTNDAGPVRYYTYDRRDKKARFLFEHQPALSAYELAPMEPFVLTSRDGLELHGYATFPLDGPRQGCPTVLDVHGGPWARDSWGFQPEVQWLANRGYLCLQVNFRGSTGYGKSFLNAGDREWGAKMHDDLLDTLAYAVGQGWTDPAKVAIFGGSYGGYAALVGAAFTPEVFCCAVDVVGPSNLITLIETIPPYWAPLIAQFHRRVGNPETDRDFLWSRSPLSRAEDITIPLLIAQGANDPRVKQAESEQIVAALDKAGIAHEYLLFPDEGHGFAKPENRLRFFAAAEAFFAEHLGGRFEP
ncbi:MAG TPA: S9 family peptidase [Acidimicrobiales bacterium]|nr:S9 family peptidase [Acidimicrobiales bacterium]